MQDGVVHHGRGAGGAVAQSGTVGHDGGVGGGQEVRLGAVERLPLTLSLRCSSLFEFCQAAALFLYHLLT